MPIIEVAVGLTFMFLVLSFCATALADALTEWRQWRGRLLHAKLEIVLGNDLVGHLYSERRVADLASGQAPRVSYEGPREEPRNKLWIWLRAVAAPRLEWLTANFKSGKFSATSIQQARSLAERMNARRLPSYIPESVFADVILDWLQGVSLPAPLRPDSRAENVVPFELAELWQRMNVRAAGDQAALRAELVAWYQQVTERISGDFKRKIRAVLYLVGLVVVLVANADTIRIVTTLYGNPQLRAQVVATADELMAKCPGGVDTCPEVRSQLTDVLTQSSREASSELLGWRKNSAGDYGLTIWSPIGWLLTILAIGMGADFWFGALKKIVSIRNAKRERASDESSGTGPLPAQAAGPLERGAVGQRNPINIDSDTLAPLKGFQPLRFAESDAHAFWMAQFSSLAYATANELRSSAVLKRHGLEVECIESGSTQVFIFRGQQLLIVAFRGTEQLPEDWITDANAGLTQQPWGVADQTASVHRGFHGALDSVWPELRSALAASQCPVWFTGHSLGGALAALAAYRLAHCEGAGIPTIGGVYTFGQPRVGNAAFARSCSLELSQRIFRYVNSSDIVPLVPPSLPIDYVHFGKVRFFDASGRLHAERTLWERIAEQLTPALQAVSKDADWGSIAREHLKRRVADHAMTRYLECLERVESIQALR